MISFHYSFATTYIVSNINSNASIPNSFLWAINQANNTKNLDTINITTTGICFLKSAIINSPIVINSNEKFVLNGTGTESNNNDEYLNVNFLAINSNDVTINKLHIQYAKETVEPWGTIGGNAITITDGFNLSINPTNNIEFNQCSIQFSDGIGISGNKYKWENNERTLGEQNIRIIDCNISNNKLSGIQFSQTNNLVISNCTIEYNGQHGIYLHGANKDIFNGVVISDTKDYTKFKGVNYSHIYNVKANNNQMSGIVISENSNNNLIEKCTVSNNKKHGIILYRGSSKNTLYQNTCTDHTSNDDFSTGILISEEGNQHNLIYQNTCDRNSHSGIFIYNSTYEEANNNNLIIENTCTDNGGGIAVLHSPQTYIIKNTIKRSNGDSYGSAIALSHASNHSVIAYNTLEEYANVGITLTEGSDTLSGIVLPIENDSVRIFGNTIFDHVHTASGILLDSAKNTYLGAFSHSFTPINQVIKNPITNDEVTSINLDLIPTANEIGYHQEYGMVVYKSQTTMISEDLVHCNQKGNIVYVNVPQTILSKNELNIEKDLINSQVKISGFPTMYSDSIEVFLSQGNCTLEYHQKALITSNHEITLDIPNLANVDSVLLHITNSEKNTYPLTVYLNKVITNDSYSPDNSVSTYVKNGEFVIENGNNSKVIISNTQGQIIQTLENVNSTEIGHSLSTGMYFIYIESRSGEMITKKYLK